MPDLIRHPVGCDMRTGIRTNGAHGAPYDRGLRRPALPQGIRAGARAAGCRSRAPLIAWWGHAGLDPAPCRVRHAHRYSNKWCARRTLRPRIAGGPLGPMRWVLGNREPEGGSLLA